MILKNFCSNLPAKLTLAALSASFLLAFSSCGGEKGLEPAEESSSSLEKSSSSAKAPSSSQASDEKLSSSSSDSLVAESSSSALFDPDSFFMDSRDSTIYRKVTIGDQTWMAENLNYRYEAADPSLDEYSMCYDDLEENCEKRGRLYTWSESMVQELCPEGWHLPSAGEWMALIDYAGGLDSAGYYLKSRDSVAWKNMDHCQPDDTYGFNALPGGYFARRQEGSGFTNFSTSAVFWSSTVEGENVWRFSFAMKYNVSTNQWSKDWALSVRCVLGPAPEVESSSSAVTESSSSADNPASSAESSESSEPVSSSFINDDSFYDAATSTLKDLRDEKTYKTTKIGNQVWMAENLNYAYGVFDEDSISFCYTDDPEVCDDYGRLYTWAAVMDSLGWFSSVTKGCGYEAACELPTTQPVRGICPKGWHVPLRKEIITLLETIGAAEEEFVPELMATYDWFGSEPVGKDSYGFSAFPAGYKNTVGYVNAGTLAIFWLADWKELKSEDDDGYVLNPDVNPAHAWNFSIEEDGYWDLLRSEVFNANSLRCLKD